jgi:hypothetical protein
MKNVADTATGDQQGVFPDQQFGGEISNKYFILSASYEMA